MHKNATQNVVDAAVRASQNAILGNSSGGSMESGVGLAERITTITPEGHLKHAFMIGIDKPGDPDAGFFRDGRIYDCGD